jgi:hypothetical protein
VRAYLIARFIAELALTADSLAAAVADLSTTDGFGMLADEVSALLRETRSSPDGETVTVCDIRACGLTDEDLETMWQGGLLTADPTDGQYERTIRFASLARLESSQRKAA